MPIEDYEDVHVYPLDPDVQEQLFKLQNECSFIWGTKDHWAVGVIMNFVWRDGRFWLTATSQRHRVAAVRRDNRVSLVITSTGTELGPAKAVTVKGRCLLHDDQETKDWFYPALAAVVMPQSEALQKAFAMTLDSPRRLVFEVVPEKYITFDGIKMMQDSFEAWTAEGSPVKELLES